ncbi:MAG: lipoyl(octanoyl) transferase LipB [SAR86 cluster bacterium]|uniref:Octanoyltransferase n=1 Tax=SAR86 cluster bacterium TaxID=2030880 RepID=A0A368BTL0_9GAMM|nr:MAG: lipoyl(octanoyl) transferase LipB [SAR86 cluster bacterium]
MKFSYLGKQPYQDTYQDMKEHIQNFSSNQIWMLEHDAVFTLGTAADESHIINAGQIPVIQTDRGGEVTYHGPGQLVIYFLIDIKEIKLGPKALVQKLQELISSILGHYDIKSSFIEGAPGVYVDGKKIASIGLRISQGKTYHGISINVDMDLTPFSFINPCGYEGLEVTQIKNYDSNVKMKDVESIAQQEISKIFE